MLPSIFGENMMDEFFDRDFFGERNPLFGKHARNLMKTDIHENDKEYELSVELPGFKKEEISLDVKDGYLSLGVLFGIVTDNIGLGMMVGTAIGLCGGSAADALKIKKKETSDGEKKSDEK